MSTETSTSWIDVYIIICTDWSTLSLQTTSTYTERVNNIMSKIIVKVVSVIHVSITVFVYVCFLSRVLTSFLCNNFFPFLLARQYHGHCFLLLWFNDGDNYCNIPTNVRKWTINWSLHCACSIWWQQVHVVDTCTCTSIWKRKNKIIIDLHV